MFGVNLVNIAVGNKMKIGDLYRFIGQVDEFVYLGLYGLWYKFAKAENPHKVWCEMVQNDLKKLEKVEGKQNSVL